jgi:hypothetical protein
MKKQIILAVLTLSVAAFGQLPNVTGDLTCTGSTNCKVSNLTFPLGVGGTTNAGGIAYFNSTPQIVSSAALTSNVLVKGGGAGSAPSSSSVTDNGTTVSTTEPLVAPSYDLCPDSSGSGTAQVCNTTPTFTVVSGSCVTYTTTTANIGTGLTVNVNSLGAKSVAKWQGTTTLAANDVLANKQVQMCYDGTNWELATIGNAPSGGSGAPGGVVIVKKTATYAGASGDYSSSSAAPSQIIFTLVATGQSYTLLSAAPASGSCVIVENSFASAPFILGIITGGSTTLDGKAYTTALTSPQLGPGQNAQYCSDGTNYYTAHSSNDVFSLTSNKGGYFAPFGIVGTGANGVSSSVNTPQCAVYNQYHTQLVTNITYQYAVGVAASTGDWGIYDSGGNLLTHTGSQATTTVGGATVKVAASPAITLPPGQYAACACASSLTVSFGGIVETTTNGTWAAASGSLVAGGAAAGTATSCTAGVLPATTTITVGNIPNVLPGMYLTP